MHEELFEAIRADHREILSILLRLQEAADDRSRKSILDQLLVTILPHMIGEEQIVYPALRPDAGAWEEAQKAMEEHRQAQELLRLLRDQPFSGEDFTEIVDAARERIEKHIRGEEDRIFAALGKVVSDRDASRILESFRREKELAWDRYPDLPLPTTEVGEIRV